ncbi:Nucleotidylyl transferase [Epithele typhae]|uniref:Nucleotidylyl transferase n=1 Tax=Epithele typhae TaxID=378194 RepID=UPI0020081577|nr:Nucleotidylyl transferase [Epithele typhae]KAH9945015.1 Nucleotidylyl transferase [Epithele typhae]
MNHPSLLPRIQHGLSTIELVHVPHPRWPLPRSSAATSAVPPTSVHVSVLDSSFNPPTLAHLALAALPPPSSSPSPSAPPARAPDFDARLLLLSVRNADKQLKPGDATFEQRVEMMVLLARDLSSSTAVVPSDPPSASGPSAEGDSNVAVAIIDEPTFAGKSTRLLAFLRARLAALDLPTPTPGPPPTATSPPDPNLHLTFLMGTDTLVRFFAPRYYPSQASMEASLRQFLAPDAEDSRILCAKRMGDGAAGVLEEEAKACLPEFARQMVSVQPDRIYFADIGEKECMYSSSQVRGKIAAGDPSWRSMVTSAISQYILDNSLYHVS